MQRDFWKRGERGYIKPSRYITCLEYATEEGTAITRSKPTTWKAAHRAKRANIAMKRGLKSWVEKVPDPDAPQDQYVIGAG